MLRCRQAEEGGASELTWKERGVTLCHTPKARRTAIRVSCSPTLGVKLEILQERKRKRMKVVDLLP